MQYGREATITSESVRRELEDALKHADPKVYYKNVIPQLTVPAVRSKRRRAGSIPTVATRRPRAGRKVLIPGKRKAARHPWADRLAAARMGGVSVDETHPGAGVLTMSCYRCGDRVDHKVGDGVSRADIKAEEKFRALVARHVARLCLTDVAA